jgi:hypothetical protein
MRTPCDLRILVACIFLFSSAVRSLEGPPSTHGTVNIALANANGMVLETDSMLSSNGIPQLQSGRKLYKADDHTVYMIASFFSALGPKFPSGAYSSSIVMRSLTLHYIHHKNPILTIDQQLDEFSRFVALELTFLRKMHGAVDHYDRKRLRRAVLTHIGEACDCGKSCSRICKWTRPVRRVGSLCC